jgi:hypothetical protein
MRILCLALCLCLCSCGYNAGLRVTEHYDSVGVELFGNESYERDLEPELHDQMTRVLRDQSDAHLVDPRVAQAVIRGTLTAFHRRGGIRDTENRLLETGIYIEVQAKLYVGGNETPVRSTTASAWVGYTLDPPGVGLTTNPPEHERDARARVLHHLAEELVLELLGPGDE